MTGSSVLALLLTFSAPAEMPTGMPAFGDREIVLAAAPTQVSGLPGLPRLPSLPKLPRLPRVP